MLKYKEVDGKWTIDPKGEYFLDGKAGKQGLIEKKWDVDIVLLEKDYDTCISYYATSQCDAVCVTTLDALPIVLSRTSVVIMPTSTSFGADALIVGKNIADLSQLKGKDVYGLSKSVSEYCFDRNLEIAGQKENDYKFIHNDPGAAAVAFQQNNSKYTGIVVWNPFVMSTLANRKDSHVLFDSTTIPGEIIDSIVMSKKSLERAAGKNAACAIADAYYTLAEVLAQKETQDQALVALGKKFSNLNAEQMKTVVRQTRFYATPEIGISLFESGVVFPWRKEVENTSDLFTNAGFNPKSTEVTNKTLKELMPFVVKFCVDKEMTPKAPVISYGKAEENTQMLFDIQYMKAVAEKNKK
jgi:NitT/TauT family transport system substrate-binding protein